MDGAWPCPEVPSIGIDPSFKVNVSLRGDIHLVEATSDDFFATRDPLGHSRAPETR